VGEYCSIRDNIANTILKKETSEKGHWGEKEKEIVSGWRWEKVPNRKFAEGGGERQIS